MKQGANFYFLFQFKSLGFRLQFWMGANEKPRRYGRRTGFLKELKALI
jgi:hypothetical protein